MTLGPMAPKPTFVSSPFRFRLNAKIEVLFVVPCLGDHNFENSQSFPPMFAGEYFGCY